MSVLRFSESQNRHYIQSLLADHPAQYRLTSDGIRYLVVELGIDDDESFEADILKHMIQRGWAFPDPQVGEAKAALAAEPHPVAVGSAAPTVSKAEATLGAGRVNPAPVLGDEPPRAQSRTRGRMVALQVLYQMELNTGLDPRGIDAFVRRRIRDPLVREFTHALVDGVRKNQARIDKLISDVAENWRIDRMAAIDRNILRIGAFEILLPQDVPPKVAINEALELAKRYSTAQSSRFVNGILDRLLAAAVAEEKGEARSAGEPAAEPPPSPAAEEPRAEST